MLKGGADAWLKTVGSARASEWSGNSHPFPRKGSWYPAEAVLEAAVTMPSAPMGFIPYSRNDRAQAPIPPSVMTRKTGREDVAAAKRPRRFVQDTTPSKDRQVAYCGLNEGAIPAYAARKRLP